MRVKIVLLSILLSFSSLLHGQTRTIYGRVIAEDDLLPIPGVHIQTMGKSLIGTTDNEGKFKIDIPQHAQALLFTWVGMEPAIIKLNSNCDTVEIVMMVAGTYDFISSRKVDELRLKQFNKLPELHLQAYKKGIFTKESICYSIEFEPWKHSLDSIGEEIAKEKVQRKLIFEKLNVGDTIKVPFSDFGGYRYDGTDRTTLTAYSGLNGLHKTYSGCLIRCIVLSKEKYKKEYQYKGYYIDCKVIDCVNCKDPSVFEGKVMKAGEVFTYDIRSSAIPYQ